MEQALKPESVAGMFLEIFRETFDACLSPPPRFEEVDAFILAFVIHVKSFMVRKEYQLPTSKSLLSRLSSRHSPILLQCLQVLIT